MQRDFLWGGWKEEKGSHLIAWDKVCKHKEVGGILGIRRIKEINRALLTKWLWRFENEENSLWRKIITDKYGAINKWDLATIIGLNGVSLRKVLMTLFGRFKEVAQMAVGNGWNTLF